MATSRRPALSDEQLLGVLDRAFAHHSGGSGVIGPSDLQKALGLRSEYLARRVLFAFDRDGDGVVSHEEFLAGARALVAGTDREKLRFAFTLHDHDGDGFIDREELFRMIAISLAESDVAEKASQPPEHLTRVLLADVDTNHDGRISFDEFESAALKHPELIRQMTRSEAIWIAPNEELLAWLDDAAAQRRTRLMRPRERGIAPAVSVALFALANVVVLVLGLVQAPGGAPPGVWLMTAGRALGSCLDLSGALILIPMMRRLLTRVRASALGAIVPVDEAVGFHRLVGHTLFALAIAHAAAFIGAYTLGHSSPLWHLMILTERGASGALLLAVFAVMWVFSLSFVRRTSRFELFYFTHLLYVVWLGLAIAHAPSFLLFSAVPLLGFGVEQILRLSRRAPKSSIVGSRALRSGVTRLDIARPPGFRFAPGDYAFLRIPSVARHEWHPFTISSAPEREHLTFHVRTLGNWTSALRRRVEHSEDAPALAAYVDGPYGSPSGHIFRSRYAVLIGAGIGVTPFASVLESLVLRANGESERPSELRKAHFFWLNRDQYSFEWFRALLTELEKMDHAALLDIHLCMTGGRAPRPWGSRSPARSCTPRVAATSSPASGRTRTWGPRTGMPCSRVSSGSIKASPSTCTSAVRPAYRRSCVRSAGGSACRSGRSDFERRSSAPGMRALSGSVRRARGRRDDGVGRHRLWVADGESNGWASGRVRDVSPSRIPGDGPPAACGREAHDLRDLPRDRVLAPVDDPPSVAVDWSARGSAVLLLSPRRSACVPGDPEGLRRLSSEGPRREPVPGSRRVSDDVRGLSFHDGVEARHATSSARLQGRPGAEGAYRPSHQCEDTRTADAVTHAAASAAARP